MEKEAQMSFCLSHMGPLHMLHSLSSECRDLGGIDASTESINVLFCLFVCPQSLRKPWGENEDRGSERMSFSSMMMREKHQHKLEKT